MSMSADIVRHFISLQLECDTNKVHICGEFPKGNSNFFFRDNPTQCYWEDKYLLVKKGLQKLTPDKGTEFHMKNTEIPTGIIITVLYKYEENIISDDVFRVYVNENK